jgi:hypothetical protein
MELSMNIGFSHLQKSFGIIAATVISSLVTTSTLAGPNQLDILGLIPGVSSLEQVKQASLDPKSASSNDVRLDIGGHKIPCSLELLNGKLASLVCFTGEGNGKYDIYTEASNTEVHSTLTNGFSKKFGKPDSVIIEPVRTRRGVEYEQQLVIWKDQQGNELQLHLMADTVKIGMITFESAEYLEQEARKNAAEEAQKKF